MITHIKVPSLTTGLITSEISYRMQLATNTQYMGIDSFFKWEDNIIILVNVVIIIPIYIL